MAEMSIQTRSKATNVIDKDNMAEGLEDDNTLKGKKVFKTPAKCKPIKEKADKIDRSDNMQKAIKKDGLNSKGDIDAIAPLKTTLQPFAVSPAANHEMKGLVAERVERINNMPNSSPVPQNISNSAKKKKMLSTRNGQLVLEEDDTDGCSFLHDQVLQHAQPTQARKHGHPISNDEYTDDEDDLESEQPSASANLSSILQDLSANIKRLEKSVRNMNQQQQQHENKVGMIEAIQSQESTKLRGIVDKLDDQEDKIDMLIGIIARQDIQIQALANKWDAAYARDNRNNIIINGMEETQGENCYHEVSNFFKNKLKLDKPIPLTQANRIGTGKYRPMLAKLKDPADKTSIFGKVSNLKQVNKGRQRPYFVTDQLPEAWSERRKYIHFLKQQNQKLPVSQQLTASVDRGVLSFDNQPYTPPIRPLNTVQRCSISPERKRMLRDLEFTQGLTEEDSNSIFTGYAIDVYSVQQVQNCYDALCLQVPNATHISCAYKLPGVDITTAQGSIDDGEHGAGRVLLNTLFKAKVSNKAIFVTRHYGGQHIGALRFQLIDKAAQSALNTLLKKEEQARQPLTQQELRDLNQQIAKQEQQRLLEQRQQEENPWNAPTSDNEEDAKRDSLNTSDAASQVSSQG